MTYHNINYIKALYIVSLTHTKACTHHLVELQRNPSVPTNLLFDLNNKVKYFYTIFLKFSSLHAKSGPVCPVCHISFTLTAANTASLCLPPVCVCVHVCGCEWVHEYSSDPFLSISAEALQWPFLLWPIFLLLVCSTELLSQLRSLSAMIYLTHNLPSSLAFSLSHS